MSHAEIVDEFDIEVVPLSELKDHPRNYRAHPEDQIAHLIASIEQDGVYKNVVVARDGTILAGHGVIRALREMGREMVPIHRLDLDPNDSQALKILAGDNEIGNLAEIDDRVLTNLLKDVKDTADDGLLGTGYDSMMLSALVMVSRPASEITDFDAAAEWVGMPESSTGTLQFQVRITCATEADRNFLLDKLGLKLKDVRKYGKSNTLGFSWPLRKDDNVISVQFREVVPTL